MNLFRTFLAKIRPTQTAPLRLVTVRGLSRRLTKLKRKKHVARILASLPILERETLLIEDPDSRWAKYLQHEKWVEGNVSICGRLGLIDAPRRRVLDIGCGTGLFLFCVKQFGHDGIGIDVESPLLAAIARQYGVDRRIAPVREFIPIDVDGTFDVITVISQVFDRQDQVDHWTCPKWRFFLSDLESRLNPEGQLYFKLNKKDRRPDAPDYYDEELRLAIWHANIGTRRFLFDKKKLSLAIEKLQAAGH